MTYRDLQEAASRQPFEPFRLILTTGTAYEVRHPELIMVGRHSAVLGITDQPNGTVYDHTIKVDLRHVVGIEELRTSPPTSNG